MTSAQVASSPERESCSLFQLTPPSAGNGGRLRKITLARESSCLSALTVRRGRFPGFSKGAGNGDSGAGVGGRIYTVQYEHEYKISWYCMVLVMVTGYGYRPKGQSDWQICCLDG
jgi:hypothetical protein